ncbi:DUF4252 domain-containing protein [Tunicatimonas pelagia]|uniref:DUF4252 domain-containing protein n=1 Tax=Tunicatimonas pelagia TaxID=931531 RepID=UPI002665FE51|nr:DUF4252 domain-containing protein [Tunicatimonas pelagia]WKN40959.1 DUF4252 domain-containing protein [Tunicatimonas pelagia]
MMTSSKLLTRKIVSVFALAFICSLSSLAQSRTVDQFLKEYQPSQKLFLYPSTLRMVNLEKNPDFYALVHDIDKLRVLLYNKNENGFSGQTIRTLSREVAEEDYQELMTFQADGQNVHLYSLGDDDTPEGVVGLVETDDTLILTDLEGFIDLPALLKLFQGDFNFEDIAGVVNLAVQVSEEIQEEIEE